MKDDLSQASLRDLATQLAQGHEALKNAALKLGGEACFAQARLDVKDLVDNHGLMLPDAMSQVYRKIIDQLMTQR